MLIFERIVHPLLKTIGNHSRPPIFIGGFHFQKTMKVTPQHRLDIFPHVRNRDQLATAWCMIIIWFRHEESPFEIIFALGNPRPLKKCEAAGFRISAGLFVSR